VKTLRISELKISNFVPFHDASISFKKEKSRGDLFLINGKNDSGKTSILNAILWCLYGKKDMEDFNQKSDTGIKNYRHKSKKTSVEMFLKSNAKGQFHVRRDDRFGLKIQKYNKKSSSFETLDSESLSEIILPPNLRQLFLFKGEYLEHLMTRQEGKGLLETTKRVTGIDSLLEIKAIIDKLETKYRNEYTSRNKQNENLNLINATLIQAQEDVKRLERERTRFEKELEFYGKKFDELDKKEREISAGKEHLDDLITDRDSAQEVVSNLQEKISSKERKIVEIFRERFANVLTIKNQIFVKSILNKLEESGLIPPPATLQLIEGILKEKECICGKDLDKSSTSKLKKLHEKIGSSETEEALRVINFMNKQVDISQVKRNYKSDQDLLVEYFDTLAELTSDLDDAKRKLKQLKERLSAVDSDEIKRISKQKKTVEYSIKDLKDKKENTLQQLGLKADNLKEVRIWFHTEESKLEAKGDSKLLRDKWKYAEKLSDNIETTYNTALEIVKTELNKKISKYFWMLFGENKDQASNEIFLNKEFELIVRDRKTGTKYPLTSGGAGKSLSLAYLSALADLEGFDFPIVIDAPFSKLDKTVSKNVSELLINLSKDRQVILVSVPIPNKDETYKKIKKNASKIYELDKNKKGDSEIKEV